jgi:hypothetical protein
MSSLLKFLQSLFPRAEPRRAVDDAFLAASVDIYDLERRMRTLDERGRNPSGGIALGLYTR